MAVEPMNLGKPGAGRTLRMHSTGRQRRIRELFASDEFIDYGGAIGMQTRNEVLDSSRPTTICNENKEGISNAAALSYPVAGSQNGYPA
jgi:hypothetical protein